MSENTSPETDQKKRSPRKIRQILLIVVLVLLAAGLMVRYFPNIRPRRRISPVHVSQPLSVIKPDEEKSQLAALKKYVFSTEGAGKINANLRKSAADYKRKDFIVFLSVCGGQTRADVVSGKGRTFNKAWENAERKAVEIAARKNYDIVWAKADIVNTAMEITIDDFYDEVSKAGFSHFYRKGIALDRDFNTAFLEAELNGNNMLTYKSSSGPPSLHLKNINNYLTEHYGYDSRYDGLTDIPGKVTTFTTMGFFCDEECNIYDLYTNGLDYGRRVVDIVDDKYIEPVIRNAAKYLYGQLLPDGVFIYGNYPVFDERIDNYNILRHAGTVWSLINLYRMTNDEELITGIDAAVNFIAEKTVRNKDDNTAYVIEEKTNEAKIGGNGLAVLMFTEYMDVFKTDKYTGIVRRLANGILELQDENGHYYHVLNYPDWTRKEEYRTVYYDGEATFALARTFTFTREQKYLDAAALAIDNFINNNYEKYTDHWVAYSVNEVTKYLPEPRYFEFAMLNVQANLRKIYNYPRSFQTSLELLMAAWQTYERIQESGIEIQYPDEFAAELFAQAIYKRAFHLLNDYFFPEYAMYMKYPHKIVDTFFQRNDKYRIRIDDVQHFIGGYCNYFLYYEKIRPLLTERFISRINRGNIVNN